MLSYLHDFCIKIHFTLFLQCWFGMIFFCFFNVYACWFRFDTMGSMIYVYHIPCVVILCDGNNMHDILFVDLFELCKHSFVFNLNQDFIIPIGNYGYMYVINVMQNKFFLNVILKVVYKVECNHIPTLWNIYHNLKSSQVLQSKGVLINCQ